MNDTNAGPGLEFDDIKLPFWGGHVEIEPMLLPYWHLFEGPCKLRKHFETEQFRNKHGHIFAGTSAVAWRDLAIVQATRPNQVLAGLRVIKAIWVELLRAGENKSVVMGKGNNP